MYLTDTANVARTRARRLIVRRAKASGNSPAHHIRELQDTYFVPLSNQFRLTKRALAVTGILEVMLHPEAAARSLLARDRQAINHHFGSARELIRGTSFTQAR